MATQSSNVLRRAIRSAVGSNLEKLNDRDLLQRFADAEDQDAFGTLFRRHGEMVLGVCRRVLNSVQDAEDACQAVFLVLARKAKKTGWQPSIVNWLYATARRVAANAGVAARRRLKREGKAAVAGVVQPIDQMTGRELLAALDEELARLPPTYRETLVLCYLEGLSREEAAARLVISPGTVKIRLERGRKKLGDALTRRGCVLGAGLLTLAVTSPAGASSPRLLEAVLANANGTVPAAVATLAKGVTMNGIGNMKLFSLLALVGATVLSVGVGASRPVPTNNTSQVKSEKPDPDKRATKADDKQTKLIGKVVDADGKPIVGAKLYSGSVTEVRSIARNDYELAALGISDKEGRFQFDVPAPKAKTIGYLIAQAPNFGVDWVLYGEADPTLDTGDITLRLAKDVPITGRVLNTEGKPIPGVSLSASEIYVPTGGKLDLYMAELLDKKRKRDEMTPPQKGLVVPLDKITGTVTTDKEGRFAIHGAGAERLVRVVIKDANIARAAIHVLTRPGLDPKPYNDVLLNKEYNSIVGLNRYLGMFAPEFTFIAEPGKEIAGTVTDGVTGKPVPGCRVFTVTGYGDVVATKTDASGKYLVQGIHKNPAGYALFVEGPEGSGYVQLRPQADDNEGYSPLRLNVKMFRGSMVSGQIVDKQTGKGVRAGVRFAPLPDNKYFGTKPEYSSYARDRTTQMTDMQGRFQLPTIPGRSAILVQVISNEKSDGALVNPYRRAVPDPKHKELFQYVKSDDTWLFSAAGGGSEILSIANSVAILDLKEGEEAQVELSVDRGLVGKLEIQDEDGKPLTGAWVSGITDSWPIAYKLKTASSPIFGINPELPRTLVVYHPEKKLGGLVTIRGDEKAPVVAKLGAMSKVTGRLVDSGGTPLSDVNVVVSGVNSIVSEMYRFGKPTAKPVITDKDGKFVLDGVFPDMEFSLGVYKDNQFFIGKPKLGPIKLKPGETQDLGERRVEPVR